MLAGRVDGDGGNDAYRVQLDTDHDKVADHVFLVIADGPLTADDFILAPPPAAFAPDATPMSAVPTEMASFHADAAAHLYLA